ncbi:MAG: alkaline phosphatase D family protein [Alphaproteobacteria bacterium]
MADSDPSRLLSRRLFLAGAGGALTASALAPAIVEAAPRLAGDPFTLGVASGEPAPDGFVIWTRLAPDLKRGGGMPPVPVAVDWELALDPRMRRAVRRGRTVARPESAHSVHVEIGGLAPRRPYWYRFRAAGAQSPIGRAVTLPAAGAPVDLFRIAVASCQHWEFGYYSAYRHMVADRPDLILHVGDYIYEDGYNGRPSKRKVRHHPPHEAKTLAQYRERYALYRSDPDLQAAHAWCPWVVTWDDHEVDNDYANDKSEHFAAPEDFLRRRAAAYQAYYEHMPLRRLSRPRGNHMQVYRRLDIGRLIAINVLDNRQYRSDQACGGKRGGSAAITDCPALTDPSRTMLGKTQEAWLLGNLKRSDARWNVLAQQQLMAQFIGYDDQNRAVRSNEAWDGYPGSREHILKFIEQTRVQNTVVLGGDIHSYWVTDLKPDFGKREAPAVATEFVGTSISSPGVPYKVLMAHMPSNPHIRYFESRRRGYLLCAVTDNHWLTDLRAVENVRDSRSGIETLRSFYVDAGRPGARPV